jgi:lipopolysaccharide/colanic/teichoic acid biosynthesis glycosyltransferase
MGRSRVTFAEWVRMDLRYIGSRSLWSDVKLLVHTVPALLFRRGW